MNRTRKSSTGTYKMESTGPKVPSRYLRAPTGSCHDYCKCAPKQTTEAKPTNPFPKRIPKPPADKTHFDTPNSVPKLKKAPSVIPKITTTRNFKNNNVFNDQILKKDVVVEPKNRESKPKSENSQAKTYNSQSSRTPRRRHSDMFIPNKDMSLPFTRFPKRRLSEVTLHSNKDLGSVSNVSLVRGSTRNNKNELRKDSKLPLANKKSDSLKTSVSPSKVNTKAPPLRTYKSLPKLELKGSRNSKPVKPIEEFVPEKTLHVIEPNNGVEITKSQSQTQNSSSTSSEVKVMTHGEDDDTLAKDGQQNDDVSDSEANDRNETTRVGKLVVETGDCSPADLRFRRGTVISPESENNSPRKLEFKKGKELGEDETEKGENKSLRRLSSDSVVCSFESQTISVDLKHQEMEEKKNHSGLINNVIEETASKLIQTRKSKVKALVGAFENIVSANNQQPQTTRDTYKTLNRHRI